MNDPHTLPQMGDVLARSQRRRPTTKIRGVNLTALDTEKLLPQNVEAEAATLGSLLIDPDALSLVADWLRADDFYREAHRVIYQAMLDLDARGVAPDLITLTDELGRRGALEDVGGASYVSSLANQVPTSVNLESYARIVTRTATLRRLITAAGHIAGVAYNEPDARVALEAAERLIREVATRAAVSDERVGPRLLREPLSDWLDAFALAMSAEESGLAADDVAEAQAQVSAARVSTGLRSLDHWLRGGMRRGNLLSVGATPGMGKTALALSIAANVARTGGRALVFSLEMTLDDLLMRLISQVSQVPQDVLQEPQRRGVTDEQMAAIANAVGIISEWTLFVDDTPALTLGDLAARARQATQTLQHMTHIPSQHAGAQHAGAQHADAQRYDRGFDLIVVDYLQLVRGGLATSDAPHSEHGGWSGGGGGHSRRNETREQEVSDVTKGLRALAKLLDVPVLALAQVNDKEVDKRSDKRPLGSDFRESSALFHDSDVAMFLYRDHLYHPDETTLGVTELLIRKNRGGSTGTCGLFFDAARTRFVGLATDQHATR